MANSEITIQQCLDYIEEVKENYQLGMLLFGKTLEECESDRDSEIEKVTQIMLNLKKK